MRQGSSGRNGAIVPVHWGERGVACSSARCQSYIREILGRVFLWLLWCHSARGEAGEGAFCPLPVCPTPVEIPPTVQCMGTRPGYGLSPGIFTSWKGTLIVVLRWSGEQSTCQQVRGRPRKTRPLPSFRVIVGTAPHASKSWKIRCTSFYLSYEDPWIALSSGVLRGIPPAGMGGTPHRPGSSV